MTKVKLQTARPVVGRIAQLGGKATLKSYRYWIREFHGIPDRHHIERDPQTALRAWG